MKLVTADKRKVPTDSSLWDQEMMMSLADLSSMFGSTLIITELETEISPS